MKKLSLRMRMTVLTSLCLTITCIVMAITLFWLANIQVVQYIDMYITDVPSDAAELIEEKIVDDYVWVDILPLEEAEEISNAAIHTGLLKFYAAGCGILIVVVILGSVLAWIVSGWSIAPVKELSAQIDRIDEQKLGTQIDGFSAGDELQKLASSFNNMLKRLDSAFDREKRFSAAAAHELKTPLTVMKASIDVLELSDEPTPEEYQETVFYLKKQISRLNGLVMDLLAFSRCQNTTGQAQVPLDQVLRNLLAELKTTYPEINVAEEQIDPCSIWAAPAIAERAFFNLLDNAAKFSPNGGTISVRLEQTAHMAVFCVKDEGLGISEAAATHIFEPFYREDQSRSRKIAGAGLGLALVKEFADTMGGTIEFSSNTPCGSVFTLSIPTKNNRTSL